MKREDLFARRRDMIRVAVAQHGGRAGRTTARPPFASPNPAAARRSRCVAARTESRETTVYGFGWTRSIMASIDRDRRQSRARHESTCRDGWRHRWRRECPQRRASDRQDECDDRALLRRRDMRGLEALHMWTAALGMVNIRRTSRRHRHLRETRHVTRSFAPSAFSAPAAVALVSTAISRKLRPAGRSRSRTTIASRRSARPSCRPTANGSRTRSARASRQRTATRAKSGSPRSTDRRSHARSARRATMQRARRGSTTDVFASRAAAARSRSIRRRPIVQPTHRRGTSRRCPGGGRGGRGGGRGGGSGVPLRSPDGNWTAVVRDVPPPKRERVYESDFAKRHEERFKGVEFDWMDFQRDAAPFPLPNRVDPDVSPPAGDLPHAERRRRAPTHAPRPSSRGQRTGIAPARCSPSRRIRHIETRCSTAAATSGP